MEPFKIKLTSSPTPIRCEINLKNVWEDAHWEILTVSGKKVAHVGRPMDRINDNSS